MGAKAQTDISKWRNIFCWH